MIFPSRIHIVNSVLALALIFGGCNSTDETVNLESDFQDLSLIEALVQTANTATDLNVCIVDEAGEETISSLIAQFGELASVLQAKIAKSDLAATDKSELNAAIVSLTENYDRLKNIAPSQSSTEFNRIEPLISDAVLKIEHFAKSND